MALIECKGWLSQGDVFESVPVPHTEARPAGSISTDWSLGPAVLFNHDCTLDKHSRGSTNPTIDWLTFLQLFTVSSVERSVAQQMRGVASKLAPYDVMYLGEVGVYGESFVRIHRPYQVPSSHFSLALRGLDRNGAEVRLHAESNGQRTGKLTDAQLDLLRQKWIAYWTRLAKPGDLL